MSESQTYKSTWWSVKLPPGWTALSEKDCVTFRATPPLGVLQISSSRKDSGPVLEDDLIEFATERLGARRELSPVTYGSLSGFMAEHELHGLARKEWWLRSGRTMLYVTYNVTPQQKDSETAAAEAILRSASVKETGTGKTPNE